MKNMLFTTFSSLLLKINPKLQPKDIMPLYYSLRNLYSEPHRFYHNINHIIKMWGEFDDARHLFKDPVAAEFALFYHDCIFTPSLLDEGNERASDARAEFILSILGMHERDYFFYARVKSNILYCIDDDYENSDAILFRDMDYAILGKSKKEYDEYRANIKKEYFFAPVDYRIAFLESLLAKKRIYGSEYFHNKYEKKARLNIKRELEIIDK